MVSNLTALNEKNFDSSIKKGKWVVDFWAEWCGPCKIMDPYFKAASEEMKGKIKFGKVNVEENYGISEKFNIRSIPAMLFFNNGEVVNSSIGAISKERILKLAEESYER